MIIAYIELAVIVWFGVVLTVAYRREADLRALLRYHVRKNVQLIEAAILYNNLGDVISSIAEQVVDGCQDQERMRRLSTELMQRHKAAGYTSVGWAEE